MRQHSEPAETQVVGERTDGPGPVRETGRPRHRAQPVPGPVYPDDRHPGRGQQLRREHPARHQPRAGAAVEGEARNPGRVTEPGVAEGASPGQLDRQPVTIVFIHDRLPRARHCPATNSMIPVYRTAVSNPARLALLLRLGRQQQDPPSARAYLGTGLSQKVMSSLCVIRARRLA